MTPDTTNKLSRFDKKNEAIKALISVMDEYNISFSAETHPLPNGNGETTQLKVLFDLYEDGDPITLVDVYFPGKIAKLDIKNILKD